VDLIGRRISIAFPVFEGEKENGNYYGKRKSYADGDQIEVQKVNLPCEGRSLFGKDWNP
jgi:hypothetical protein